MKPIKVNNGAFVHLLVVCIISIVLALLSISISLIDGFYNFFYAYTRLPVAEFLVNLTFLFLTGLLWLTYRRWRKAAAKQAELENIISSISPDTFLVVDPDRKIVMCNPSVQRMFGYTEDEVISQKTDFLYSRAGSNPNIHSEIYNILEKEGFHIGLAEGKSKGGKIIPLEIITGNLSGRSGAVLLLRDITEHKRAEEVLKGQLRFLQGLVDTVPNPLFYKDAEGRYTGCNKAFEEFVRKPREEILGKTVYDLMPREIADKYYERDKELLQNPGRQVYEDKVVNPSGGGKDVIFNKATFTDASGQVVGLIGVISDITERKNIERELRKTSQELEKTAEELRSANQKILEQQKVLIEEERLKALLQMAGATAHELNQPLTSLLGNIELIKMSDHVPEELVEFIDRIEEAGKRISNTVKRIRSIRHGETKAYFGRTAIIDLKAKPNKEAESKH